MANRTPPNGLPRKPDTSTPSRPAAPTSKRPTTASMPRTTRGAALTPKNKAMGGKGRTPQAASVAGGEQPLPSNGVTSAYAIMASRIANRVAEMAESITFVERPRHQDQDLDRDREREGEKRSIARATAASATDEKKRPRKLEMRLNGGAPDSVAFSAPFLDNTLQKMLALQHRMLRSTAELSKAVNEGGGEEEESGIEVRLVKEHASQSAELSRIIALICAEKARQGA